MFYVTDLTHFEGIEDDPAAPGPAVRLSRYLQMIVQAATIVPGGTAHQSALPCHRRPGRRACPGRLLVGLQGGGSATAEPAVEPALLPSRYVQWECPSCGEGGVISNWQGAWCDLSGYPLPDEQPSARRVVLESADYRLLLEELGLDPECGPLLVSARPQGEGAEMHLPEYELPGP